MTVEQMVDQVCEELNVSSRVSGESLLVLIAAELAAGVTAERDAEIAGELPAPYTARLAARAQIDGDTIHVPRVIYVDASVIPGRDLMTSARGRRQAKAKRDVAVGIHTVISGDWGTIYRFAVLWRREK